MKDLVPHGLHLTDAQMRKLLRGHTIQISKETLGMGAGKNVIHLGKKHSNKMMRAYNARKGLRLKLEPEELEVSGAGFFGKAGKALKSVARNKDMQKFGQVMIDYASPFAGQIVTEATGDPALGELVSKTVNGVAGRSFAKFGEREVHKKKRLAGGNITATGKDSGKRLIVAGTDRAVRALEGSGMHGGNITKTAKKSGSRLIVAGTDRAVRALEGSGLYGYGFSHPFGQPVNGYGIFNSPMNAGKKYIRRQEGKVGLGLATQSAVYKNAMRRNMGVSIANSAVASPAPKGMMNKNVAPAGNLMTMSPYARANSPQMHPFVPTNSYQNSGVSYNMR